jgi:TPR repeat protein
LEKATSKNYAKGIYYLGNILEFVKKDYIKAFAHYT